MLSTGERPLVSAPTPREYDMQLTEDSTTASARPVAVIGCGVIGRSWLRVFTRAGHQVRAWDPSPHAVQNALAWHATECARDGRGGGAVVASGSFEEALRDVCWCQESGPESVEGKRALYAALDAAAPPDAVLASSTSTIDMTLIADGLAGGHRCIVAHPVNPPHVIPVVEVLGGAATSAETVARAMEMLRAVGQFPVLLRRYVPGFLLNRMQAAIVREAISLVERGVADVEAVDAVIHHGLGLRWALMGPFGVANTNADGGVREYFTRYGPSFTMLMDDLGGTPRMDAPLIERLGEGVDAMVGDVPRGRIRAWRDRLVERLTTLKRDEGAP